MISGIVYFEEIVENIKDITGIEILANQFEKINRFIFNTERDIGAGGLIVRKKKAYTIGDGYYDGNNIIMPHDFVQEYSVGSLSAGVLNGNVLTLNCKGPDEIDISYLGFLLDSNGNAITTRNHMEACVLYARHRLYSAKVFQKTGSQSLYREFKAEYNDEVLASRGNDAFPTEEQWKEIGATLNGSAFDAYSNCGIITVGDDCNDNTIRDSVNFAEGLNTDLIQLNVPLQGGNNSLGGSSYVSGLLTSFTQPSLGSTILDATLTAKVNLSGSSNGSSSLTVNYL